MKKSIIIGLVIGVVFIGWEVYSSFVPTFPAERILQQSKFKNRTFNGKTEEVFGLDGKLSAYLMEEHSLPIVAVSFGFAKAGTAYEPKDGVVLMAESVLLDGAGHYNRKQLREIMREKGIKLSVSGSKDRLEFGLSYVKEFEREAMDVLKAVLYAPRLADEDMILVRQQLKAARKQQEENPEYKLARLVQKELYGSHPYGKESIPTAEVLAAVNATDIRNYLADYMTKDTLKIGFAGDIDKAEAEAFMVQVFGNLKDTSTIKELEKVDIKSKEVAEDVTTSAQSFVLMVGKGIARNDKDFYPLYVADYVFGGSGLSSRISQSVREKEGLTYGIYSYFGLNDALNTWNIYFSATPENVAKIRKITEDEYVKFYSEGITEEELRQAKKSLMSSFNLRFAGLINISEMLEMMQVDNLGKDFLLKRQSFIENVTLKEVNEAIKRKLPKSVALDGGISILEISGKKIIKKSGDL